MDYRRMSSEAKAAFIAQRPHCELCGAASMEVDHDHVTHKVRGALCRVCNGRLGSLESALRLPKQLFQSKARDLHRALWRDGAVELSGYQEDFAYLGLTMEEYAGLMQAVHDVLVLPYVYWTEVTSEPITRETPWTKIGPLCDDEEAQRHLGRLVADAGPPYRWVHVTREPDDGVNSPRPRGLVVAAGCTEGAIEAGHALRSPVDMSAFEAKCRDFVDLVVPVLLSRPLTEDEIRSARRYLERPPRTPEELRVLIGERYAARWLDLAVRIVLEDLGEDLPDRRWAMFSRARHHWRALFAYWRDRRACAPST